MEPFLEPSIIVPPKELPPSDPKKLKRIKKKLDELNRKIKHSRKKHDGMIHKKNALGKAIAGLKGPASGDFKHGTKPEVLGPCTGEPKWTFMELEQAFGGAHRSYRVNGRPKMDVETFFSQIKGVLINLISKELMTHTSVKIQTSTWIRFIKDDDQVEKVFNSSMMSVYRGSDLEKIVNEIFTYLKTQIENPALLNSRFVFNEVLFLDINFHPLNLTRGSSYLPLPDYIAQRKDVINPQNRDKECFKWQLSQRTDGRILILILNDKS